MFRQVVRFRQVLAHSGFLMQYVDMAMRRKKPEGHVASLVRSMYDPRYRGRTFNRMLNNSARGRVERMASSKLAWLGIPDVVIPSFHTSTCDYRHGVVDKAMRRGERFTGVDGLVQHADAHASETVAQWLLLKPAKDRLLPA